MSSGFLHKGRAISRSGTLLVLVLVPTVALALAAVFAADAMSNVAVRGQSESALGQPRSDDDRQVVRDRRCWEASGGWSLGGGSQEAVGLSPSLSLPLLFDPAVL